VISGFTDIHQHLIYGMDDGPRTRKEAEAMIRAARRDGIRRIIVTPHIAPGIRPFDIDRFVRRLEGLQIDCARIHGVELFMGAEIFYTDSARRYLNDLRIPTLAETEYVLVEFSPEIRYAKMRNALEDLLSSGYIPVLAHIERYQCLVRRPQRAIEIKKRLDVRFQVNCSTIVNGKGHAANRFIGKLFTDRIVDAVASDAHNLTTRPAIMSATYRILKQRYGGRYADHLTGVRGGFIFSGNENAVHR